MSRVALPTNLHELWRELDRKPSALLYAGGTDLLVRLRQQPDQDRDLICLERLSSLKRIELRGDEIFMGAGCTHAQLLESPLIRRRLPVLAQALCLLGSPLIRNVATIGGNIVTASPAGDTLPPLYALDASVEIISPGLTKRMAIKDFIKGPGQTALLPGQVLSGVAVKPPPAPAIHHFEKVGQRAALAISIASLAALVQVDTAGIVLEARLAWGSVGPTVITCRAAGEALRGRRLSRDSLSQAAALAKEAGSPIDDIRASAAYRRKVAGNLLLRLARL
jgi:CO/xanthine dehydrogenase FAD-binding subunit